MTIHLTIDRLVLDGLGVNRPTAEAIRAAMAGELSRLLSSGDLVRPVGGSLASVRSAPIALDPAGSPQSMGVAIAQSVQGGIPL